MFARRTNWSLATNRLTQAIAEHRSSGRELLDLTESNPTRAGITYDAVTILSSLVNPKSLDYSPEPFGLLEAREAVCRYYAGLGVAIPASRVLLTTSTSEAYTFVFRLLCDPESEILIPTPSYPLFEFLAGLQDVKLVPYPLLYDHGWQVDFAALERAITPKTRAVMVVHPNNPTGSLISASERARLNDLCAAHSMAIVADEVFLDYLYEGIRAESFAGNESVLTFVLSGLSKIAGLPQMKSAWIATSGPPELREQALARLEIIADTYLSMNAPIQHALPALLDQREKIGGQLSARVRHNLDELDAQLAGQPLCRRLEVQAGWYAILRVPAHGSDEDLCLSLLQEQSVLVQPGYFYDFRQDGFLVLSLITPRNVFREGLTRLLRFISEREPA
jgi:aspartate/methionine/tyrosine aminotransferase